MSAASRSSWYALAVHVRSEATVAAALSSNISADNTSVVDEVFLPSRVERRMWSDRIKRIETPLFPGYVFIRAVLDADVRKTLLAAKQVYDLVGRLPGDARIAHAIPDAQVQTLQVLVAADRAVDPIHKLVPGREVVVASGALRGARGVVETAPDGHRRLVVQVALLGRGVRTTLLADDVVEDLAVAA